VQHLLSLEAAWAQLRLVTDDLDGDVADDKAGVGNHPCGLLQQRDAGGICHLRAVGAEVGAQISQPSSREERVADSMGGDVAIRVAGQRALTRPGQPRE
jgi:hypothetical protein